MTCHLIDQPITATQTHVSISGVGSGATEFHISFPCQLLWLVFVACRRLADLARHHGIAMLTGRPKTARSGWPDIVNRFGAAECGRTDPNLPGARSVSDGQMPSRAKAKREKTDRARGTYLGN
jgi:hypothetical protein